MFENIKEIAGKINKKYGMNLVRTGETLGQTILVPFGEPGLDYICGGGNPTNRVHEFLGNESCGKTRDALLLFEQYQKFCFGCHSPEALEVFWETDKDGFPKLAKISCKYCKTPITTIQVIVDVEGTLDASFLQYFDIDTKGVIITTPETPSQSINIVEAFARNPEIGVILVDSIGAYSSDSEVESAAEDVKMNSGARVTGIAVRKWQAAFNANTNKHGKPSPTTIIVVNRMYSTIGIYATEVAQGGRALRHALALSTKRKRTDHKDPKTGEVFGFHRVLSNGKNKIGKPHKRIEDYINLDPKSEIGYCRADKWHTYLEIALKEEIIKVGGGGYYFFGDDKYHGREKMEIAMREHPEIIDTINAFIYGRTKVAQSVGIDKKKGGKARKEDKEGV